MPILYFFLYVERIIKNQENFLKLLIKKMFFITWEMDCYCFQKFYIWNSFQDSVKHKTFAKD